MKEELVLILAKDSEEKWLSCVNRIEGKNGHGENKFWTYRKFKNRINTEPYVYINMR